MRLIGSRDVLRLTGLSADQLREWTVRRGLIQPDIPASRQGQQAQFGWQTVLLLRLAVVMRTRFHIELQAHRNLLTRARELLDGRSFPSLWGSRLVILGLEECELLGANETAPSDRDAILLRLNDHLETLSQGFGVPEPIAQLQLFPAIGLRRHITPADTEIQAGPRSAAGDAA
ncbi:hypothetical protein [Methylobacterium radiotolerans]|uniref:hypothetical protein n=1 Tax=Methylobacterium radiotolerans TaxID=31998 RepID=UPI000976475E|nr:hypothetical protein [Methylobacterium radiotolerans]